jgi:hypothetical protein
MQHSWWASGLWILLAGALGFAVSAVFASLLHWSRDWFLLPYTVFIGAFLYAYGRWSRLDLRQHCCQRWRWGLIGAVLVSLVMVMGVVQQPAAPRPQGGALVFALLWEGVVYGTLDALLLTVMPVLALERMGERLPRHRHWSGRIISAVAALAASLFVTAAYHWGYTEFRGPPVMQPLIGNAIITLGYLLTMHPMQTSPKQTLLVKSSS